MNRTMEAGHSDRGSDRGSSGSQQPTALLQAQRLIALAENSGDVTSEQAVELYRTAARELSSAHEKEPARGEQIGFPAVEMHLDGSISSP